MGLAEIKAQARSSLHAEMSVPASYESADGLTALAVNDGLTVRWHYKLSKPGQLEGNFDAVIVEGIDRLVFQQPQLDTLGVTLGRGDIVRVPAYGPTAAWELDNEEETDGPLNRYWAVTRVGS